MNFTCMLTIHSPRQRNRCGVQVPSHPRRARGYRANLQGAMGILLRQLAREVYPVDRRISYVRAPSGYFGRSTLTWIAGARYVGPSQPSPEVLCFCTGGFSMYPSGIGSVHITSGEDPHAPVDFVSGVFSRYATCTCDIAGVAIDPQGSPLAPMTLPSCGTCTSAAEN